VCRAFLAKGVLLKRLGRAGDAQRMFLQARYLAPPSARVAVDQIVNR
jgi:Flp pilus assembly protein TadD